MTVFITRPLLQLAVLQRQSPATYYDKDMPECMNPMCRSVQQHVKAAQRYAITHVHPNVQQTAVAGNMQALPNVQQTALAVSMQACNHLLLYGACCQHPVHEATLGLTIPVTTATSSRLCCNWLSV